MPEAAFAAVVAGILAALFAWLLPPGPDFAAHAYYVQVYAHHGFALWNNLWYSGSYSFVTYSLLYYPLAALVGIRPLAVLSIAAAAFALSVLLRREFGPAAVWPTRAFAVLWPCVLLSAAFPFALGSALMLAALCAVQRRRLAWFALLALLTFAASPLAFAFLAVVVAGIAIGRRVDRRTLFAAGAAVVGVCLLYAGIKRAFPDGGFYPFPAGALLAALVFCVFGAALVWRVAPARVLRPFFVLYAFACVAAFLVPSPLGANVTRLRFAAVPIALLLFALRDWRPRKVVVAGMALAAVWNIQPVVANVEGSTADASTQADYWAPAVRYLERHLDPSYRVEVVDTVGHWGATYLPRAGIPLTRGWFRQYDFPQNEVLYGSPGAAAYRRWLRGLGVQYVVLTSAPPDYSAAAEAALVGSGRAGLRLVFRSPSVRIYAVPSPRELVTGPGRARVLRLTRQGITLRVGSPGTYRVAVRSSAYWHAHGACLSAGPDGMLRVATPRAGIVSLQFEVDASGVLAALGGNAAPPC
ncbi:MAG TPA: hypothetical protein VFU10_04240 [Gaiellaceae bacterium]|nr:hypothetical protein [Gaiellaceae bacterium]